jgi:hypothetical protein
MYVKTCVILLLIEGLLFIYCTSYVMTKLLKTLRDQLTPHIVIDVRRQGVMLTILWVTSTLVAFGLALALVCLYSRILILEQAITALAS